MKLSIKQKVLMEHLNYVIRGISSKNLIPILNCIKFELTSEGLYLLSTDNELAIKSFIPASEIEEIDTLGEMLISGRYIYDIVRKLSNEVINNVKTYMIFWALIVFVVTLILSIDNFPGTDFFTHFSASITCIGNVGPGFNGVGPIQNFANYSSFSKIILSFEMLIGRLEIFPIFIMLSPKVWQGK